MNSLPPILNKVIESFKKFPGIGGKTAHRLGLHALKSNAKEIEEFAQSLLDLKNNISTCSACFNFSESDLLENPGIPCDLKGFWVQKLFHGLF